jgi:hypothetical protein
LGRDDDSGYGCVVSNFAILSEEVRPLLHAIRDVLHVGGTVLIQTVHPWTACGDQPYRDGWREETFTGWEGGFRASMPWVFRTMSSWFAELRGSGFELVGVREPLDPESGRPLSLLFVCRVTASEQ